MHNLVTRTPSISRTVAPRPSGTPQRALIAQWQAAGSLLVLTGMVTLAVDTSLAQSQPSFVVLYPFLVAPFGIAALSKRLHLYSLAANCCFAGVMSNIFAAYLLYSVLTLHVVTTFDQIQALLLTAAFVTPIVTAARAQLHMGTALYDASLTQLRLGR